MAEDDGTTPQDGQAGRAAARRASRRTFLRRGLYTGVAAAGLSLRGSERIEPPPIEERRPPPVADRPHTVRTVCPFCPVGCGIEAEVRGTEWLSVAGTRASPVNRGVLCPAGTAARELTRNRHRLDRPLALADGRWRGIGWDTALDAAAHALTGLRDRDGPDSVIWLGGPRLANEQAYLLRKFAAFWGTNSVDSGARLEIAGSEAGLSNLWGYGAMTNPPADLANSRLIVLVGADPAAHHPVLMEPIGRARAAGAALVVAGPRRTATADAADRFVRLRAGADVALAWGVLAELQRRGVLDFGFLARMVYGWGSVQAELRRWNVAEVERVAGVGADDLRALATLFAERRPAAVLWAGGGTAGAGGSNASRAFAILQLALGNIGGPGGGVGALPAGGNTLGALDAGLACNSLPGHYGLSTAAWKHWARVWQVDYAYLLDRFASQELMERSGVSASRWPDAVRAPGDALNQPGPLRGAVLWGFDVAALTRLPAVRTAIEALDLLVVVDTEPGLAAALAPRRPGSTVLMLPAAAPLETDGSVTGLGRITQWRTRVLPPAVNMRTDEEILYRLSDRLGFARPLFRRIKVTAGRPRIEDVTREMYRGMIATGHAGLSADRLKAQMRTADSFDPATGRGRTGRAIAGEAYGLPWPVWGAPDMALPDGRRGHPGTPVLYDASIPVLEGGHCFQARFGIEREGQSLLAQQPGPKDAHFRLGYGEFFMVQLRNLRWDEELAPAELDTIERIAGDRTNWRHDLSGGIVRVVLAHGCVPSGNGMARALVWNFPDPVPRHREPVLTERRDLVDAAEAKGRRLYPAHDDARLHRMPTRHGSLQREDFHAGHPLVLLSDPVDMETRLRLLSPTATEPFWVEVHPDDASRLGLVDGRAAQVEGIEPGSAVEARVRVTDRVPPGSAFVPSGFLGLWARGDLRERWPGGTAPASFGPPANLLTGYGYDRVGATQEGRRSLCRLSPERLP